MFLKIILGYNNSHKFEVEYISALSPQESETNSYAMDIKQFLDVEHLNVQSFFKFTLLSNMKY